MTTLGAHPLVEIRFTRDVEGDPIAVRHWYHVPRPDDFVTLRNGDELIVAIVRQVTWSEPNDCVYVRLR